MKKIVFHLAFIFILASMVQPAMASQDYKVKIYNGSNFSIVFTAWQGECFEVWNVPKGDALLTPHLKPNVTYTLTDKNNSDCINKAKSTYWIANKAEDVGVAKTNSATALKFGIYHYATGGMSTYVDAGDVANPVYVISATCGNLNCLGYVNAREGIDETTLIIITLGYRPSP